MVFETIPWGMLLDILVTFANKISYEEAEDIIFWTDFDILKSLVKI